MKKHTIAFDCDGTLITADSADNGKIVAREMYRSMLIAFYHTKNCKIIVWSGSGELWARQVVRELGLTKYVHKIMAKNIIGQDADGHPIITADVTPDIAIDDIQSCELGKVNVIVRNEVTPSSAEKE
jgi:phosphoserine phosphatase